MSDTDSTTLVVREYFSALDCARSLTCWLLFKYEEHQQLVELAFNPLDYNLVLEARDSLAATSFLSKATFLVLQKDKSKAAYEKFYAAESECLMTNDRLAMGKSHGPELFSATRKIAAILGSFCSEEFFSSCSWGPGATLNIRGDHATATRKFDSHIEITPACYNLTKDFVAMEYPLWFPEGYPPCDFKSSNKVITVPKNAKTDRIIAIEPSQNLWFQKGIGSMIRRRLLRSGIDLRDQGHNQRLCRIGSKFNNLATIDFSAASDTISNNLVLQLIPEPWLTVICNLRSPRGNVSGSLIEYEKFSSMGNGFTFELESLLFYTLALSCCEESDHHNVSIYGDDLIVPVYAVPRCLELFSYCGFTINSSKSFWDSPYRESCGKHYWNGQDITPVYLKESITSEYDYYKIHNAIRSFSHRLYNSDYGCDSRFASVCNYIRRTIRKRFKRLLCVPYGFGDGGAISNFDEASPSLVRHGHQGFQVKIIIDLPRERWSDSHGLLLNRLWCTSGSERSYGNIDSLPRRTRQKTVKSTVAVWRDIGPWI